MNTGIEFAEKLSKAYSETCKPLCHELNIPQTAFDILLFLANNPEYKTARDIVEIRKIKANLVSVNVDKLVNEGYLERKSVEGDRRKVNLICTEKSKEIIQEGQKLQQSFVEKLFEGMDEDTRKALQKEWRIWKEYREDVGGKELDEYNINDYRNIFRGDGSRTRNRICRNECGGSDQSDADHISWNGSIYGSRNCTFIRCTCKRSICLYIWKE